MRDFPGWMLLMFGMLMAAGGPAVLAQDSGTLSLPDEVRPDTVYGRVGHWFEVRGLDGKTMRFPELSGRVLFVNFWATWCAPCVEEMPTIIDLMDALADTDVAFLLISIDEHERPVRRFVKKHKLPAPVPVYFPGWPPGASTFTAGIVPATFIVSKKGAITYQHHGAANWNAEPIHRFLRELALQ